MVDGHSKCRSCSGAFALKTGLSALVAGIFVSRLLSGERYNLGRCACVLWEDISIISDAVQMAASIGAGRHFSMYANRLAL
jgi:hypothetical protein